MQRAPQIFTIETTLACDLRCPECAIGGGMIQREKELMSFASYRSIADKIRPYAKYVYLHIWGEPMLNPDIFDMIRYTASFAGTNISTNGQSMTAAKARELVAAGVTDVIVSIDGATQEVYRKYRVGGEIEKAFGALALLVQERRRQGKQVNIIPQFIVFEHNQHEMEAFAARCRELGLTPAFKAPYIRKDDSRFAYCSNPAYQRPHLPDVPSLQTAMSDCPNPREVFTVLSDGSVVACCHDYAGATTFGNIFRQEVMEIWESPACRAFRNAVRTGHAPEFCVKNCMSWFLDKPDLEREPDRTRQGARPANFLTGDTMPQRHFGTRRKSTIALSGLPRDLEAARAAFLRGEHLAAIDIYEQLLAAYPAQGVPILAELYDRYQELPQRDRYHLYQSRHFDFGILPGDKVLDIGSGHIPFPLATHLSDISLKDHSVGRGGAPFRHVDGKPVFECPVEEMPFADKEFDFVYCSHVLEHTRDPERACRELMRVAKRGYIETPSRAKDVFLASAKTSNHTRGVELRDGRLVFSDYGEKELEGIGCEILQSMHSSPQSDREKAFAALIWLKADVVNTMLLWEGSFEFESRQAKAASPLPAGTGQTPDPETGRDLTFLQVHTFYPSYLDDFYRKNPGLERKGFSEQMNALVRDGFSGIHMFAPYMGELGYQPHFVVANNPKTQAMWLHEQGIDYKDTGDWLHDIARLQVEAIRPDVLYLSDPINFDAGFLRTLSYTPKVVLGWRAANISAGTDWSGFDVMLSSLSSLRAVSLTLGARTAEHFFPGFPSWVNLAAPDREPVYDVVFSGSWTATQHPRRNEYLVKLARAASEPGGFSLALYLNAAPQALPPEVQRYNKGGRFGVAMHEALKTGRIVVDARGVLEYTDPKTGKVIDLAGPETANMRIFEATGSGCFLLAEAHQNLNAYFEPGVELETFRDEEELLKKIRYYLDHPSEREEIARRGKERCLAQYSMEKRAEKLSELIHKAMGAETVQDRAEAAQDSPLQGAAALKEQAAGLLAEKRVAEAFDVLIRAKALKSPLEGLDLLRAHCFLAMGQFMAAKQSLLEELRFFPENREARAMLQRFEAAEGDAAPQNEFEPEFKQLLAVIRPYSMLGELRLYSLFQLAKYVCQNDIPGNFVECGVAAGGSSALLAYTIKTYSKRPRTLYSFDSFSGMPTPGEHDVEVGRGVGAEESGWGTGTCAAPVDSLMEVARKLGVVSVVKPVKGYYEDTLPKVHGLVGDVAFIHIDSDWYESTRTILENFYDQIHPQALIQFDDYGYWKGCGKALHEFEKERGISFSINDIDGCGVWFRKA